MQPLKETDVPAIGFLRHVIDALYAVSIDESGKKTLPEPETMTIRGGAAALRKGYPSVVELEDMLARDGEND